MSILVIGSFMMDQVATTKIVPERGETVIGQSFEVTPGGKGANQAVAASRLAASVTFAGKLGNDNHGKTFLKVLNEEGISTEYIKTDDKEPTGVGCITKETNGDNRIIVVPGANMAYTTEELIADSSMFDDKKVLIMQLEMQIEVVESALKIAKGNGITTILNPAPAQDLNEKIYCNVDYLTPNETELEILTNTTIASLNDAEKAAHVLIDKGVKNVVVTLGDKGSLFVNKSQTFFTESYDVDVVDTVAAGDSFNGALAVGIVNNYEDDYKIKFCNAVGALTVSKKGAINSLPSLKEVNSFIEKQS